MGKNYAESSLKRFLKQKVRITLGLVVTFLITGAVAFAGEEKEIIQKEHKNEWELLQVKEAKEYLKGENQLNAISKIEDTEKKISLETKNNGDTDTSIILTIDGKEKINTTLKKENISDKVKTNLNSALTLTQNMLNGNFKASYGENDIFFDDETSQGVKEVYNEAINKKAEIGKINVNEGNITGQNSDDTEIIINKGTIKGNQNLTKKGTAYNFGYINGVQTGTGTLYNFGTVLTSDAIGVQEMTASSIGYNYGILMGGFGQTINAAAKGYNYGVISVVLDDKPAQFVRNGAGESYNYGYLLGDRGQVIRDGSGNIYNYGLIESKKTAGQYFESTAGGSLAYNYGTIIGKGNLQLIQAENSEMYNFGELKNTSTISEINSQKIEMATGNSKIYNYGNIINGEIAADNKTGGAQYILGHELEEGVYTENKAYNYGNIEVNAGNGQLVQLSGEIYNYGTISVNNDTGYGMAVTDGENYKAVNYGIIKAESGKAFSGDIINRGFVITQDGTVDSNAWTGINQGVVLDKDLNLAGDRNSNVIDLSKETGKITLTDEKVMAGDKDLSGTDVQTTVFMKNQNAVLTGDKYDGKNINIVVDNNYSSDKALVEANLGENTALDLTNTTVAGYFTGEKGGTVLAVDSDLTLVGDTVISAIKGDNVNEDVFAISLEKDVMLTFVGEKTQINGMINGKEGGLTAVASQEFDTTGELNVIKLRNANDNMLEKAEIDESKNYTDVTLGNKGKLTIGELQLSFRGTTEGQTNKVHLTENVKVTGNINGGLTINGKGEGYENNQIDLTLDKLSNIGGNITLGEYDDTVTVNQKLDEVYSGTIDGNLGEDTLVVNPYTQTRADLTNELNYTVKNMETVELGGTGKWVFGENLNISSDSDDKNVTINTKGTLVSYINGDYKGSLINKGDAELTVGEGNVKYYMGEGFAVKDSITLDDVKLGEKGKASSVVIYDSKKNDDGTTTLTLKSAEDIGATNRSEKQIYEILLNGIAGNDKLRNEFNKYTSEEQVLDRIGKTISTPKAYYTSGYIVTKNIADTYSSMSESLDKKAEKGQWLAQGKYINSDTEFDGGTEVKGYDGDITGVAGMIEYGVSEQASYGVIFGKGDTKVDIDGGGDLEGDNYYIGTFVKYRTLNGIDLIGNLGFVKSDLDSTLSNEITFSGEDFTGHTMEYYDGTADSKAITLSLTGKKDFYISDSVRLQPKAGIRYNFIQQDEAENKGMNFRIAAQDVTIIEGLAGMGIVKDIELNSGKLSLNAGLEYTLSNASQYDEMQFTLEGTPLDLETSEIADSRGLGYIGADYEHENGVGFNAKYEMIWSDTGDDSRITAGVSYRF